jgi:hypothetical protein
VKPRSFVACSPIRGIAVTGAPAWRSTTSLMFCAQIVGNPPMLDPSAAPLTAAAPFNKRRRDTRVPLLARWRDMAGSSLRFVAMS